MDPVTLTAASLGATALGGATTAFGSLLSGNANAATYKYQAGVAQLNKRISLQNADYARSVGEVEAQKSGMKTRAEVGATTVAQAGSGLDINKGSAVDVRGSEQALGQYDQAVIRSNAAKRAYGFEVEAAQSEAQTNLDIMAGKASRRAGVIGAAGSLLGTAGSVAARWQQASTAGVFS